jgi:hypothetical protein
MNEDDTMKLGFEPEEDEEGIGEWIPQPYFGEHLTAIRWAVRTNTLMTSGSKVSAPNQKSGVLRHSWKRVYAARNGIEVTSH